MTQVSQAPAEPHAEQRTYVGIYHVLVEDAQLIADYQTDQKRRGLLPTTMKATRERLALFAQDNGPLLSVEPAEIDAWLDTRRARDGEPVSVKTRSCWLTEIAGFYRWAVRADHALTNPVDKIIRPKLRKKGPRPIAAKSLKLALKGADPRLRAWITIEALAGLRCQEVAYLAAEDIERERKTIFVTHGKGAKERRVPLHPDIVKALEAIPDLPREGRLWPNETPAKVSQKINRYFRSIGIKDTAHALRHFAGTEWYRRSKDLLLTGNLMGHASIAVTQGYADFDRDAMYDVVSGVSIAS